MKIVQRTAMCLILQEQPLGIGFLGRAAAIAGFAIFVVCKPPVFWWGGVLIAIASIMLSLSPTTTCTFDKVNNQLTLRRQRCFSRWVRRHPLHNITEVQLAERTWLGTQFYQVSLVLSSGQHLPITQSASTDWHVRNVLVEQIRTFLGQQPQTIKANVSASIKGR